MGGTWFLGKAVVEGALARGWEVTTFNRGRSAVDVPGTQVVRGDRTNARDLEALAAHGRWDAIVDTSASEMAPRDVLLGTQLLADSADRYVYVSTVSVYQGWPDHRLTAESPILDGPADADEDYGRMPAGADGPNLHYGRQKAGAERAVLAAFGPERSAILRPGVILGPGEYVGRLPYWLRRAARGGLILSPGRSEQTIQPIDVRDVAGFLLDQAAATGQAVHNLAAPIGRDTMGAFLASCLSVTGGRGSLVWAPDEFLVRHGVRQWTEIPLWRTHAGVWQVDATTAVEAGFRARPLEETVRDTWAWLSADGRPVEHPRASDHGLDPDKEQQLLAVIGA
ncbi:NAD-dependent epimerase/dehydratase family protein [Streptacidiphilus sp. BW17]|uniref:NAD-dependent epimerase/dehydratase family protein n=1 Tax=Streptacidiphilus sp. BW17 TaxID=3156274 RepID=UPI003516F0AB